MLLLIALGIGSVLYANDELKLLTDSLRRVIDEKHVFVKEKEDRINRIKCMLKSPGLTLEGEYRINLRLYNEYKKFHIDSAIHYVDRNIEISRQLNRPYFTNQSSLHLSLLYSMCGRFREAEIILKSIKTSELPRDLLINYYQTYSSFWGHYSISVANNLYGKQQAAYQDSLFALIDHTSWDYRMSQASYYIWRDTLKSKEIFKELLEIEEVGTPNYAMITHSYSRLCHHQKKYDEEKKYLMLSAIADTRNATRENASLQSLALIAYDEQNLADAFKFTQSAIDDVISSGIHFRAIEIYKFNSIINTAYQAEQARSRSHLTTFLISTSIILFLLVLLVLFIYIQMKNHFRMVYKNYEKPNVLPFTKILPHNFSAYANNGFKDYREKITPVSHVTKYVYRGFEKACHFEYKFDSNTEKELAYILENDKTVLKWLRPASNQFHIYWDNNSKRYEPDFVVETEEAIYMIEPKSKDKMSDADVIQKADAAKTYCKYATEHNLEHGGKPWYYLLIPHDDINTSTSLNYLISKYKI